MGGLRLVGIDHLSPSGANTLMSCERQFVARYGPETFNDPPTEATAIGGGFAHALEFGSLEQGLAEYQRRRPVVDPVFSDEVAAERNAEKARAIITHAYHAYMERWGADEPNVEREVASIVTLPGCRRVLQVRVDGFNKAGGFLVEDKLRSASTLQKDKLENEIQQGKQLSAEIYAHWRKTGDIIPIDFRNLRKPDPRTLNGPKDNPVPLEDIDGIVAAHFQKEVAIQPHWVRRTLDELMLWEGEMVELAQKAERLLAGNQKPIRNPDACHAYGRECPLLGQCQGLVAA